MIRELCTVKPHPTDIDTVRITCTCIECRKPHRFDMPEEDWFAGIAALNRGELVQRAFPNLDRDHREMFLSRICPSCFDSISHD
jgi:hypothetical protein